MSARTSTQALADAARSLVEQHDVTSVLAQIVADCAQFVPADAAAFLARSAGGGLEVLSATSHKVVELELYQAQANAGPCVDATNSGEPTDGVGGAQIVERWPEVGQAIVDAGFHAVHAFPMRWRGAALGGLNLFSTSAGALDEGSRALAQNFADFATLAIVQPDALAYGDLVQKVTDALEGRILVEQAKGVLAYTRGLNMAAAYDELVARASSRHATLGVVAAEVLREAQRR